MVLGAGATTAYAMDALSIGDPVLDLRFEQDVLDSSETAHPTQLRGHLGSASTAEFVAGVTDGTTAIALGGNSYIDLGSSEDLLPKNLSLSF